MLSSLPREAYAPAGGGNNENGCILTTHTLIVNPVNVADRAGASPASGDHPLIRSFASLQPPNHLHPNVLRTSSFETCTLYQNPLPFFSLSLSLPLSQSAVFSFYLSSHILPLRSSSACTRVCTNAHRDIDNAYYSRNLAYIQGASERSSDSLINLSGFFRNATMSCQ